MMKNEELDTLAPSVDVTWRDAFVLELRLQGASGRAIADALVEVEAHCAESGQSAIDAFGPAVDYAKALELPDESRWTAPQLIRTWVGLLLIVGGFSFAAWGGVALAQGEAADVTVGALVSGVVTLTLMVLLFVFTDFVVRLAVDHTWWAALALVAALAVTVLSGLPFDDIILGSTPALVPLITGVAMLVAGALWTVFLKKTGNSLDDPLVPPEIPTDPTS